MPQTFYKYQGTGNDFIIIDNRDLTFNKNNTKYIADLCDRRFGIGADGLMLLENHPEHDFTMVYYNADGNASSMCGNGGRCLTAFAKALGIINDTAVFEAVDGLHHATIKDDIVHIQMQDVTTVEVHPKHVFLDTGSPHHVQLETALDTLDVKTKGAAIRYGAPYNEAGSNVNFVTQESDTVFKVRTYERGVEDETLSCGTGVVAVALAMHNTEQTNAHEVTLNTLGGHLKVRFKVTNHGYTDIWLIGPAKCVFKGELS